MDKADYSTKPMLCSILTLFTSAGTLICCALPALLVAIGAGASLASMISAMPWLITLSQYKIWTFGISGLMLLMAAVFSWYARFQPCPVNPLKANACERLRKLNLWVLVASILIWCVGFFFAFIAVFLI